MENFILCAVWEKINCRSTARLNLFLFVLSSYLSNYADQNTFFASGSNLEKVKKISRVTILKKLRDGFLKITKLLMLRNVMCLGNDTQNETFISKDLVMKKSKEQKILGVTVDNKLNCKSYIMEPYKKTLNKNKSII